MMTEHAAWQNGETYGSNDHWRTFYKIPACEHSPRFIAAAKARARYAQAVWTYHEMLAERWRDFGRPSTSTACATALRRQWDYFAMECRDISREMNAVTGRGVR